MFHGMDEAVETGTHDRTYLYNLPFLEHFSLEANRQDDKRGNIL